MSVDIDISIPSDPKYLCLVRGVVECVLRGMAFDDTERGRVVLALDEAATNIIRHSCGCSPDYNVELKIKANDKELKLELKDFGDCGTGFDPSKERAKDMDNITPGGFGVSIIKRVMDSVEFTSSPKKGNLLKMTKKVAQKK